MSCHGQDGNIIQSEIGDAIMCKLSPDPITLRCEGKLIQRCYLCLVILYHSIWKVIQNIRKNVLFISGLPQSMPNADQQ